jgi:hypothetical protein
MMPPTQEAKNIVDPVTVRAKREGTMRESGKANDKDRYSA